MTLSFNSFAYSVFCPPSSADRGLTDNQGMLPCHVARAARALECFDALAF
jgi:hypothetical protein